MVAWIATLIVALPIASHQTDHLTGGGFDVPGSQSKAVSDSLEQNFAANADGIGVLLKAEPGASPSQRTAAVLRVRRAVAELDRVTLSPAAARRAEAQLQRTGVAMLPLRSDRSSDLLIDSATTLRTDLDPGTVDGGVTTYLAGQPTIWAGMQELSKEDLAKAEAGGFPIVALILLVVFGSLAAAALPLALGFISVIVTGALIYFISLNMETSVFVTNMASMIGIGVAIDYSLFILARYREERRAGRSEEEARCGGPRDLGTRGHLLGPGRDRLPRRALDGRQPGIALDGAGGDDRRRRLDPHRNHPAARADRDARRPGAARAASWPRSCLSSSTAFFAVRTVPQPPTRCFGSAGPQGSWPVPGRP